MTLPLWPSLSLFGLEVVLCLNEPQGWWTGVGWFFCREFLFHVSDIVILFKNQTYKSEIRLISPMFKCLQMWPPNQSVAEDTPDPRLYFGLEVTYDGCSKIGLISLIFEQNYYIWKIEIEALCKKILPPPTTAPAAHFDIKQLPDRIGKGGVTCAQRKVKDNNVVTSRLTRVTNWEKYLLVLGHFWTFLHVFGHLSTPKWRPSTA